MRKLLCIISLLFTILAFTGALDTKMTLANPSVNSVTLFARMDESLPVYNGVILSPYPEWTGQQISNAYEENVFTLYPNLGHQLNILGTVLFRIWLRSDVPTFGRVTFALFELSVEGDLNELTRTEGYIGLNPRISDFNFAIANINETVELGSTLQFRFRYDSDNSDAKVYLLWNDVRTPTQVVIHCEDHISFDLKILDSSGKPVSAYNANRTEGEVTVWIKIAATNPFGLHKLKMKINITDSFGANIIENKPMAMNGSEASFYSGVYFYNASFPVGAYIVNVMAFDVSENKFKLSEKFSISYFYLLQIAILDGDSYPLSGANYTISGDHVVNKTGYTNSSGWIIHELPSSNVVGPYELSVVWKNKKFQPISELNLIKPEILQLKTDVFKLTVRCVLYGVPLSGANVSLLSNSSIIANDLTGFDGSVIFQQIPSDEYTVRVNYISNYYEKNITVDRSYETLIAVEIPYLGRIPYVVISMAFLGGLILVFRRRKKLYPATLEVINRLVEGGLPGSGAFMILGPSASGKTVLVENLIHRNLEVGRSCIFIATVQFPSEIRKEMNSLDMSTDEYEVSGKFAFIDCYSGAAGKLSDEKYCIHSITDLTRLGTELSTCLETLGKNTDVFLDSLAPWIASLKPEFIISFIHTTGAKIKAGGGRFYFTMGTSVDKEFLTKMDEASDGVIELSLSESEKEPRRKLRLRKIRGRKHTTRWFAFSIVEGEGIEFRVPKKFTNKSY